VEQIDSHVHVGPPRYLELADYWSTLQSSGTTQVVLVQSLGSYDNSTVLAEAAAEHVRGAVVAVDFDAPNASSLLRRLAVHPKVRGLRLSPSGRWDQPADPGLWPAIENLGLLVSIPAAYKRIVASDAERLVQRHADVRFRLEHVGGVPFSKVLPADDRFAALLALHRYANVAVMWSGFFLNAGTAYPYEGIHRHLELVLDRFGPHRIAWSGDVNRADLRDGDYARDAALFEFLPFVSDADRRRILANTLFPKEGR
jgi:L-fuconolactonase